MLSLSGNSPLTVLVLDKIKQGAVLTLEEITRILLLASTAPFSIQLCGEVDPKGGLSHNNNIILENDAQGLVPSPGGALCLESGLKHLSF